MARAAANDVDDEWVEIPVRPAPKKRSTIDPMPLFKYMARRAEDLLFTRNTAPIFHCRRENPDIALNTIFENSFPPDLQQVFHCSTCAHFLNRFGDLCLVDESTGALIPLFWDTKVKSLPSLFHEPVKAMVDTFKDRSVGTEFRITKEKYLHLGTEKRGGFDHMAFDFPKSKRLITPQVARNIPATNEQREMLERILKDYSAETVRKTASMLLEDRLPYADAHKAAIRWLRQVQKQDPTGLPSMAWDKQYNIKSHLAASAFIGCLHQLRSGALSILLNCVQDGWSFTKLEEHWRALCDPKSYLRPQAAPTEGNIAAAEKLFEELGLKKDDLRRRYITMDDIPEPAFIYKSVQAKRTKQENLKKSGIFKDVVSRAKRTTSINDSDLGPPKSISFTNFVLTVLPTAKKVEIKLDPKEYLVFCIAGYPGSKPLMQWHTPDNLVSVFTFTKRVDPSRYNLHTEWNEVTAIFPLPHLWDNIQATTTFPLLPSEAPEFSVQNRKQGFRYLFAIDGIQDNTTKGLCLFPQNLKSEFHPVRATIEAYSNMEKISPSSTFVGGIDVDRSRGEKIERLFRVIDFEGQSKLYKMVLFE
ncbi:hypothetical protein FQN53_004877 [Emmonsiellopsis sp. PD_33]|nr:hypothetical protein FQN53_004877 [Emmonsiellopsis sp. PD_33]